MALDPDNDLGVFLIYGEKNGGHDHPSLMFQEGSENAKFVTPTMFLMKRLENITWTKAKEHYDSLFEN